MLLRVAHKYWLQEFLYWLYPRVAYCTVLGVMFLWKKMAASDYHPFVFRILKWFGDSCGFDSCKKNLLKTHLYWITISKNNIASSELAKVARIYLVIYAIKNCFCETTMYTPFCWCTCLYLLYVLPADWDHWSSTHSYIIRRSAEKLVYTKLHPADRRTYTSTHSGIKNSGNKKTMPIVIITTQVWLWS